MIIDRLIHHAEIINIKGKSFRAQGTGKMQEEVTFVNI